MGDLFQGAIDDDLTPIYTDQQKPLTLVAIQLMNWGTFDDIHSFEFDQDSSCLTGINGAGKSTAIDAYNTLLNPSKTVSFNAAVGEKKSDRNLISYMRGKVGDNLSKEKGDVVEKCKRPGSMVSSVLAQFERDDGVKITLGSYYVLKESSITMSDVDRVYFVARSHIHIHELNSMYAGKPISRLLDLLNDDKNVFATRKFQEYQIRMLDTFRISNTNAPALLQVAMGIKALNSVNDLVQSLVLPKVDFFTPASSIVAAFSNLKMIRQRILDDKHKLKLLAPLAQIKQDYLDVDAKISLLSHVKDNTYGYLNARRLPLYQKQHTAIVQEKADAEAKSISIQADIDLNRQSFSDAQTAYNDAGGDQIERVRDQYQEAQAKYNDAKAKRAQYELLSAPLDLAVPDSPSLFQSQQQQLESLSLSTKEQQESVIDQLGEARYKSKQAQTDLLNEQAALAKIALKKDSNVAGRMQDVRDLMVTELSLDRSECLYIAEFIDVSPEHEQWRCAIERALSSRRETLFIHSHNKNTVQSWLDGRHLGVRIEIRFFDNFNSKPATFLEDGFLRKLDWRDHPYRDSLKHFLADSDLSCVDDLRGHDRALTINGSIKRGRQHFLKDDRFNINDKDKHCLGFTNEKRLAVIESKIETLSNLHAQLEGQCAELQEQSKQLSSNSTALARLTDMSFESIDTVGLEKALSDVLDRLKALEKSSNDAMLAKQDMERLDHSFKELDTLRIDTAGAIKTIEYRIERSQESINKIADKASESAQGIVLEALDSRFLDLPDSYYLNDVLFFGDDKKYQKIADELSRATQEKIRHKSDGVHAMTKFIETWPSDYDVVSDIDRIDDFLSIQSKIENDELPDAEHDFNEHMSRNSIDTLTGLSAKIDQQRRDYADIIEEINDLLAQVEFRPNTHLEINSEYMSFVSVETFDRRISELLKLSLTSDHDAIYAKLEEIINHEDSGLAFYVKNKDLVASKQVLDPRTRFSFRIIENNVDSDIDPMVFSGTGSLSGGEAETCVALIVAASLHYILKPEGFNQTPMLNCVFIDEAFSNLSSDNATRIVNAYKKMGLTLHLIAPPERLAAVEGAINSVLLFKKDTSTNSSGHARLSWQEAMQQTDQD
ncbi:hypothetical protein A3715_17365 [Oleiphilus sp. HI0009]|nr:hypothetical protein A3715_17365 [Oleiphilus sp. HI0009]